MEGSEPGPRTYEASESTKERGPPGRVVGVCDLENNTDPDAQRWQVLQSRPDWLGPGLDDVLRIARWTGVEAARAASLDVDHRIRTGRHPVRSAGGMTAGFGLLLRRRTARPSVPVARRSPLRARGPGR